MKNSLKNMHVLGVRKKPVICCGFLGLPMSIVDSIN